MTPNLFAYVALLVWPLGAAWLFRARQLPEALAWTILGAQMLLPVGAVIKVEMVPPFDKYTIANISALIGCVLVSRRVMRMWHGAGLVELLVAMYLASPIITSLLNGDDVLRGPVVLPGVGLYDAFSAVILQYLLFLPFFLGRQYLRHSEDIERVLRVLAVAGIFYSPLLLFEIRMSPQLQNWIYGYSPAEFIQSVRGDGYRPIGFMGHGLLTAFFVMTSFVAAAAFWRLRTRILRIRPSLITSYMGGLLLLCKSTGATLYGFTLVPLVRLAQPRLQILIAAIFVTVALLYPALRASDVFPTLTVLDVASEVSKERSGSLQFRFDNEDKLLAHANERLWFGWGRYGRNRVYDEETGRDETVTDGAWVITFCMFGLFGFIAQFGLLALPVFKASVALKRQENIRDKVFLAALSLIVAINMIELLPNSSLTPWTWLLAGALLGRAEFVGTSGARKRIGRELPFRAPARRPIKETN